jgi:hypothetical protein
MRRLASIFAGLLVTLAACGVASPQAAVHSISGTFTLTDDQAWPVPTISPNLVYPSETPVPACEGKGGYADVRAGAQILVRNQDSTLVGTGLLSIGEVLDTGSTCRLEFTVDAVPDSTFYSFELGRRGEVVYSSEELQDRGYHVDLTLGND